MHGKKDPSHSTSINSVGISSVKTDATDIDFSMLQKTDSVALKYATQFSIDKYGEYSLITISDKDKFFIVPENKDTPTNVPSHITVLHQPLNNTYLVSSAVMDFLARIEAMGCIQFSGTKQNDWYIPEARQAMKDGAIQYAGKYNTPDYELLIGKNCPLAIENTMIYHKPDVKEKLEELGIAVFVERSTYESHPLGRLEWIKAYGTLFNKEKEADQYFEKKISELAPFMESENTSKKVAFFYVTQQGTINARKPYGYISKLISLAGGTYVPSSISIEEENALSTFNMQAEDFYSTCVNADIIIYNNNIAEDVKTKNDLLNKNDMFADFHAVQTGNLYSVGRNFFQETTSMIDFIKDMHIILTDSEEELSSVIKITE